MKHSVFDRLAYLIIREDLENPVVKSQVLEVLTSVGSKTSDSIFLLWFYRADRWLSKTVSLRQVKKQLRMKGIKLVAIPFLSWRFPVRWYVLPLVFPQWLVGIAWARFYYKRSIFHCRSYHAGLTGIIWKKMFGGKIIFDPRSPFPEENVAAGRWARGVHGIDFNIWKRFEKFIIQNSDIVISTSRPFSEFFKNYIYTEHIKLIPNNYTGRQPKINSSADSGELTICYAGSLGHWNNSQTYLRFMNLLAGKDENVKFRFILSQPSRDHLESELAHFLLLKERVEVCSVAQNVVLKELSSGLAGVQIMEHPDARLGIKVVEYLAAGLPVIVSSNVKGAVDVIRKYDVGIVLDESYRNLDEVIDFIYRVRINRVHWRERCQKVARDQFSSESVAEKLFRLYTSLG